MSTTLEGHPTQASLEDPTLECVPSIQIVDVPVWQGGVNNTNNIDFVLDETEPMLSGKICECHESWAVDCENEELLKSYHIERRNREANLMISIRVIKNGGL